MIYPTILVGYVSGPLRLESVTKGPDIYAETEKGWLWRFRPIKIDRLTYVVTHLQKRAHFGFLLTKPFGFHFWFHWHLQEWKTFVNENGPYDGWASNTERGIYIRSPGYRWDFDLGMIPTGGYIGSYWD